MKTRVQLTSFSHFALAAVVTLAPCALNAQSRPAAKTPPMLKKPAAAKACTLPDTTAPWFKTQREFQKLDEKHDWTNDSLRTALIEAARTLSQSSVTSEIEIGANVSHTDTASVSDASARAVRDILRDMASRRQWPTRSMVGVAGVHAAWLVSRDDTTLAKVAMHRMMEAGPGEASPADVAVLEDRLRLANGRKQIYASQIERMPGDKYAPAPTEDLAHVDMRRGAAALPKLSQALCAVSTRAPSNAKGNGGN